MRQLPFFLLLIIAVATSCNTDQIKIGPNDLAIQNVSIVDVKTGELWENMTLIISGNQIDTIVKTADISLSGNGLLVEGSGKFLIPGL